jgi:hypothetical protein
MDYTTLLQVLGIMSDTENPSPRPTPAPYDDTVIAEAITAASRAIDREVTGDNTTDSDNYFMQETKTLVATGPALINREGDLYVWMRKPVIQTVTALRYRKRGDQDWIDAPINKITTAGYFATYWNGALAMGPVMCQASYTGGFSSTPAGLPNDLQRAAAILAARYFKEGKTGLGDVIGVAELGTVQYTKAIPLEVLRIISPYTRPIAW